MPWLSDRLMVDDIGSHSLAPRLWLLLTLTRPSLTPAAPVKVTNAPLEAVAFLSRDNTHSHIALRMHHYFAGVASVTEPVGVIRFADLDQLPAPRTLTTFAAPLHDIRVKHIRHSLAPQQLATAKRQHPQLDLLRRRLIDLPLRISAQERTPHQSIRIFWTRPATPDFQLCRVFLATFVRSASGFGHFLFAGWGMWLHA
jgi:hypothetical protein